MNWPENRSPLILSYKDRVNSDQNTVISEVIGEMGQVLSFQFGMIWSSDTHTWMSTTCEENYFGKLPHLEPAAKRFEELVMRSAEDNSPAIYSWQMSASGLAAVWAQENTSEAIFDAMARKEVYTTTGTRMTVRVFAGWDFQCEEVERPDFAAQGQRRRVPMGGELASPPASAAPTFMVRTLRDPDGGIVTHYLVNG